MRLFGFGYGIPRPGNALFFNPQFSISNCVLNLDSDLGITTSDASISDNLLTWTLNKAIEPLVVGLDDPDGGTGAFLVQGDGTVAPHYIHSSATNVEIGHNVIYRCYLKAGPNLTNDTAYLRYGGKWGQFNLISGTVVNMASEAASISDAGNGWWLCEIQTTTAGYNQADIFPFTLNAIATDADVYVYKPEIIQQRVSAWADQTGNTDVAQATAANQPLYNGSGLGLYYDGSNDQLVSNVALSTLRYLHSEATVFIAMKLDFASTSRAIMYTAPSISTNTGLNIKTGADQASAQIYVMNGTGTNVVDHNSEAGSFGTGRYVLTFGVDGSGSILKTNANGDTDTITGSLATASDSSNQLYIYPFENLVTIYQVLAYDRKLSTSEIAQVENYLANRWSIPLSINAITDIDNPAAWFDSSQGITLNHPTIDPDASDWTMLGVTVDGDATGYQLKASSIGPEERRIYEQTVSSTDLLPVTFKAKLKPGTMQWTKIYNDKSGTSACVNISTGAVGDVINCSVSVSSIGDGYQISVTTDTWDITGAAWSIYAVDANSISIPVAASTVGDVLLTVWDIEVEQNRVSAWADQSNTNDLAQATAANQPLYIPDVQNGLPVLRFDGGTDNLVNTGFGAELGDGVSSLWTATVMASNDTLQNQGVLEIGKLIGDQGEYAQLLTGNTVKTRANDAADEASIAFTSNDYIVLIGHLHDGQLDMWVDGVLVKSTGSVADLDAASDQLIVGSYYSVGYALHGDIGEVAVGVKELTTAEVKLLSNYLASKWGIT